MHMQNIIDSLVLWPFVLVSFNLSMDNSDGHGIKWDHHFAA